MKKLFFTLLFAIVLCHPAQAQTRAAPEAATGFTPKQLATAQRHMVVAAHPLASGAALKILRNGGSAADAAIAAQLVLNLVEPQSSGIGGGAFALHWDQDQQHLSTIDGRETAPRSARPERFLQEGKPIPFRAAVKSGLSVGVPGLVRLLDELHTRHGKLPWRTLFEPAIQLATNGFTVSARLNEMLTRSDPESFSPAARAYFFDQESEPRPVGSVLKNPQLAQTLRVIAEEGARAFYSGSIAQEIVSAAKSVQSFASDLTAEDLMQYRAVLRDPVCAIYRDHNVCGMGPPSSGAITIGQTLMMLDRFNLGSEPADSMQPNSVHLVAEAQKLAYADRQRFIADSDFVPVPKGLLAPAYVSARAQLIDPARAAENVEPGLPPDLATRGYGRDGSRESAGTTHISVVDADGNAVSMTSSIESAFGSGIWAAGFLLNNQLTDFSFAPADGDGTVVANAVAPGKRPRSSMAPTIVFTPDGKLFAVLGSPGGSRIILYVIKSLIALIDWKLGAQQAVDLPNFGSRGNGFEMEHLPALQMPLLASVPSVGFSEWYSRLLRQFGHEVELAAMTSGSHVIVRRGDVWEGGADPRREGVALGDN